MQRIISYRPYKNAYFMHIGIVLLLALFSVPVLAQDIQIKVGDSFYDLPQQQTQTEIRPGWKIVDIQTKSKTTRYLWGGHANQLTDDALPVFAIVPSQQETLVDYAIIRLRTRKQYRWLPKPELMENEYQRLEPNNFKIEPYGREGFLCQPLEELLPGEYILVNLKQQPVGELGDFKVYAFQVR